MCDPRRNLLLAQGTKTDRVDADKLSELLRLEALRPVFVPTDQTAALRQLAAHYGAALRDRTRAVQRLQAIFRRVGIRCAIKQGRVPIAAHRLRAEASRFVARALAGHIEWMGGVVSEARQTLVGQAKLNSAFSLLQTIPYIGEIRAAQLVAFIATPQRFRNVRQFWSYAGLGVERRVSGEHRLQEGHPVRNEKRRGVHRLNRNCQPYVKKIFKDAALAASIGRGELRHLFQYHVDRGKSASIARVAVARKLAAIVFAVWRSGIAFNASHLTQQRHVRGEHQAKSSASVVVTPEVLR